MVTVNYVFLCAFFLFVCFVFLIGGDACRNTAAANACARFKKKKKKMEEKKILVEYNETFLKKEKKKWGKKSRKM